MYMKIEPILLVPQPSPFAKSAPDPLEEHAYRFYTTDPKGGQG